MIKFLHSCWSSLIVLFFSSLAFAANATTLFPDMPVNRWVPLPIAACQGGIASYAGGCPATRGWVQLAYDNKRQSVILMGGSGEWYFNDLWRFSPAAQVWTSVLNDTRLSGGGCSSCEQSQSIYPGGTIGQTYPTGRDNHQFIYDAAHDFYWLFGGTGDTGFWRYNPNASPANGGWTNMNIVHDGVNYPYAKFDLGTALVPATGKIYFFGGETPGGYTNETWSFNTNTGAWTKLGYFISGGTATLPAERGQIENAMVYDTPRNQMILFGGRLPGGAASGETWTYNIAGNAWAKVNPAISPSARDEHFMSWDAKSNVAIMGGGQYTNNDTWVFNPANNTWQEIVSARGDYTAAYGTLVSTVYLPDVDLTVLRDVKGNMYVFRLDLSQPFNTASIGPVTWTPTGTTPLPVPPPVPTPVADTTPPQVSIANPANSATVTQGSISVNVNATDNVGVTSLQLFINGSLQATSSNGTLAYNWNTSAFVGGSRVNLQATAKDAAGNQNSVTINVDIATQPVSVVPKTSRGDFNADGKADIFWRNDSTGENWIYMMDGTSISAQGGVNTVSDQTWKIAGIADFNGDGKSDVLWRNVSSGENWIYLMNGTGISAQGRLNFVADQSWKIVGTADFNGDGKADILWRNSVTGESWMYLMNGINMAAEGRVDFQPDLAWKIVGSGDFDGDGKADILWRNTTTGANVIYLMNGYAINSQVSLNVLSDQAWQVAGVGDFDGDGKADILWRNSSTGATMLYLINANSITAQANIAPPNGSGWRIAAVADYNGDGKADILWRNDTTGENYMYLMNGGAIASQGSVNVVSNLAWKVAPVQ